MGVLIAATAFFVAAEFALVASDKKRFETESLAGNRSSQTVLRLLRNLSYHLTGAQLGITVTAVILGFIAEPTLAEMIHAPISNLIGEGATQSISLVIAIILVTFLTMILGELIPKNVVIAKPNSSARILAKPFQIYSFLVKPLIYISDVTANSLTRAFGVEPAEELIHVPSIEDLDLVIKASAEEGIIAQRKMDLLNRSIKFSEKDASDVMTPRVSVHSLKAESTIEDLISLSLETGHSRFPVISSDLDNVMGVAHVKAALTVSSAERSSIPVSQVMSEVLAVPETRNLVSIMADMRQKRIPMVIVVDEHGGTEGLVSVEDLLEEIVGEIEDEYDSAKRTESSDAEGVYTLEGSLHLHEVEEICGLSIPKKPYETIGGFALDKLQRIPTEGEVFRYREWKMEVIEMDRLRIAKVRLTAPPFHSLRFRRTNYREDRET
ncbi:MAG: hemolysin family protein [Actinomycetota bacterium]